jgi:chromosome segregation ATPase
VLGELQKKETAFQQARDTYEQFVAEMAQLSKEQQMLTEQIEQRERATAQLEGAAKQLEETERSMIAELGTDLLSQLTKGEQEELKSLTQARAALAPRLVQLAGERAELESRRNAVQVALTTNLYKRRDELRVQLAAATTVSESGASPSADSPLSLELAAATRAVEEATKRAAEAEHASEEAQKQIRELRESIEELREQERQAQVAAAEAASKLEQLTARRSAVL